MSSTVERVEWLPFEYRLGRRSYGCDRVRAGARAGTLVRLTTSDGAVGWGECFGPPRIITAYLEELAPRVVGRPVDRRESLVLDELQSHYLFTSGGLHVAALSGVEMALWDALGRGLGVSVADLLGGRLTDCVQAYASTGYVTADCDRGEFREQLEVAAAEGFTDMKIKIGLGVKEDRHRAEVTRDVIGPTGRLMVDFNGNHPVDVAYDRLARLRDLDLYWAEEPIQPEDTAGWAHLRRLGIPLAGGEALYTRFGFRDVIAEHRLDIVQPDVTTCGGFTESKVVAQMAVAWNVRVAPHCWGSALSQAATLQLIASLPRSPSGPFGAEPIMF
ncbi:MAG: mandelate racemase/muconate lactonizing enzyme family protein, partial [Acetobacteraceae bacterium]